MPSKNAILNGDWHDPATWSQAAVPVAGDDVYIGGSGGRVVTISTSTVAECANIYLYEQGQDAYSGTLSVTAATASTTGVIRIDGTAGNGLNAPQSATTGCVIVQNTCTSFTCAGLKQVCKTSGVGILRRPSTPCLPCTITVNGNITASYGTNTSLCIANFNNTSTTGYDTLIVNGSISNTASHNGSSYNGIFLIGSIHMDIQIYGNVTITCGGNSSINAVVFAPSGTLHLLITGTTSVDVRSVLINGGTTTSVLGTVNVYDFNNLDVSYYTRGASVPLLSVSNGTLRIRGWIQYSNSYSNSSLGVVSLGGNVAVQLDTGVFSNLQYGAAIVVSGSFTGTITGTLDTRINTSTPNYPGLLFNATNVPRRLELDTVYAGNGIVVSSTSSLAHVIAIDHLYTTDTSTMRTTAYSPAVNLSTAYAAVCEINNLHVGDFGGFPVNGRWVLKDSNSVIYGRDAGNSVIQLQLASTGTVPNVADVRIGVSVGEGVGTLVVPPASTVLYGTIYDDDTVGELDIFGGPNFVTETRTATQNGPWVDTNTWGGETIPTQSSFVYTNGKVITVDGTAECAGLADTPSTGGLVLDSGGNADLVETYGDPLFTDTLVLAECDGSLENLISTGPVITAPYGITYSGSQTQFGKSASVVGGNQSLSFAMPDTAGKHLTIEFWWYPTDWGTSYCGGVPGWGDLEFFSGNVNSQLGSSRILIPDGNPRPIGNQWNHCVIYRNPDTSITSVYIDGAFSFSTVNLAPPAGTWSWFRSYSNFNGYLRGYTGGLRITLADAPRYSGVFVPAMSKFITYAPPPGSTLSGRVVLGVNGAVVQSANNPLSVRTGILQTVLSKVLDANFAQISALSLIKSKTDKMNFSEDVQVFDLDPLWGNVTFACNFENAPITNIKDNTSLTVVGVTLEDGLFGKSGKFSKTSSSALSTTSSVGLLPSTGDFTIEAFVKVSALPDTGAVMMIWSLEGSAGINFEIRSDGKLGVFMANNAIYTITANSIVTPGIWKHMAVSRVGGSILVHVAGLLELTIPNSIAIDSAGNRFNIGRDPTSFRYFDGMMDNICITSGVSRYPAGAYTVPTVPYPNTAPTGLFNSYILAGGTSSNTSGGGGTADLSPVITALTTVSNNVILVKNKTDKLDTSFGVVNTAIASVKTKTDQLVFTDGKVDANTDTDTSNLVTLIAQVKNLIIAG